jgi:hypothetical protein
VETRGTVDTEAGVTNVAAHRYAADRNVAQFVVMIAVACCERFCGLIVYDDDRRLSDPSCSAVSVNVQLS